MIYANFVVILHAERRNMTINESQIDLPVLHLVGEEADRMGLECYVIGGWVRDQILHRHSKDIDIVVVGSGIALAQAVATRLGKKTHLAVFKTYGTAQVKHRDIELEFVGARRESYQHDSRNPIVEDGTLEEDQNRRDFTINALAICLNQNRYGEMLDPFDGIGDIQQRLIRTPLNPDITFSDDPLRMMRAIRFATQLDFNIFPETFNAICKNRERINIITKERIVDELNKIMLSPRPSKGWRLLDECGLLAIIFPELAALKGVETKEGRGHKDVFYHTLQVLDNVATLQSNSEALKQQSAQTGVADQTAQRLDSDSGLWLRWAALLHDIGKPRSKAWDPQVGWTFRNHNYIGAKMVPRIFKKMKLPLNDKMDYVVKMVDLHMRPINLIEDTVTDSAVRRLLFEAGDDIDDLMLLCDADITSHNAQKVERFHRNYELVRQKMVELEERDRIRNFQPPVRGDEIMQLLHLEPCSTVGELKNAIKEAILDGVIKNDYNEALAYLYKLAKEQSLI